ncbi:MAG: hypothetical protein M3292_04095 [Actinomycetota bacterium]|nr:hypothetical protein [Actinomycetota bacterium]
MPAAVSARRLSYTDALEAWDTSGILDAFADDVVIHVAVHDAPMRGKDVADFLFGVLREELGEMNVTDEILEDDKAVVLFETSIDDTSAQGLNVIRLDRSGAIRELTVFFRPLAALSRIAEVVGARMAERFGPPPE